MSSATPASPFRDFDGWLDIQLYPEKHVISTRTKADEIWQFLKSYSVVKSRGNELMTAYLVPNDKKRVTIERFSSFITQAENYWRGTDKLSFKSSPLLYYYSFLNLVKAYLVLVDPDLPDRIKHGLSWQGTSKSLTKLKLSVGQTDNNVFARYHKKVFSGNGLPISVNLIELFSYLPANSLEFEESKLGDTKVHPVKCRMMVNKRASKYWAAFAIPKGSFLKHHYRSFPLLKTKFEFCDIPENTSALEKIKTAFNVPAAEWASYDFFQSNDVNQKPMISGGFLIQIIVSEFNDLFGYYKAHINRTGSLYSQYSSFLSLPYSPRSKLILNEEVSAYAVMFFMSELVRYRPDFLDNLFGDRLLWLFESYVNSYPVIFLNYISSRIMKTHIKIETD